MASPIQGRNLEVDSETQQAWERQIQDAAKEYADMPSKEDRDLEIYRQAQLAAKDAPPRKPEIPKYIEIPVEKDWTSFGSMAVPGNGMAVEGAKQMRRVINPAWVQMMEDREKEREVAQATPQPNYNGVSTDASHDYHAPEQVAVPQVPRMLTFEDVSNIQNLLKGHYRVTGFVQANGLLSVEPV